MHTSSLKFRFVHILYILEPGVIYLVNRPISYRFVNYVRTCGRGALKSPIHFHCILHANKVVGWWRWGVEWVQIACKKAPKGDLSRHNVMGIGEGLELDIIYEQ